MASRLINCLATTEPLAAAFSDAAVLQAMLDFEVALAHVQARLGVIPARAADAVSCAAVAGDFDAVTIARDARGSATIVIPFVSVLTARVAAIDRASAGFVHWGATSQDVFDTALVLCLQRARGLFTADHRRLLRALVALSDAHVDTVMLGRTLLQPAPPITFGLKVAGWAGAVARAWTHLDSAYDDALVLQFGGAVGTLAALGNDARTVEDALAAALGLTRPDAPWHTHRDRLAALSAACGIYTGVLGKIAGDVSLLMQDEVGEVIEPGGGSSTMPHKRNPSSCAAILGAATRTPGLVATALSSLLQDHERGLGTWHAEAPTVVAIVEACGSALAAAADMIPGLTVKPDRMRANIAATGGVVFAERVTMLIAAHVGRDVASRLVADAVARSRESGRSFGELVAATPGIARHLDADMLDTIDAPEAYLGAANAFRERLIAAARATLDV